jgi:hypothetical protein
LDGSDEVPVAVLGGALHPGRPYLGSDEVTICGVGLVTEQRLGKVEEDQGRLQDW